MGPAVRRTIRPWDHLRDDHVPYPVYLNEWRESDYRSVFERALSVVAWSDDELRGVSYLSPALTEELASYTERDLLILGDHDMGTPALTNRALTTGAGTT